MLYLLRKGEQLGPYSEENIQTFLKIGSVEYTDFAWQEGWSEWKPVAEIFPPTPTPPPPPAPNPKPYEPVRSVGEKAEVEEPGFVEDGDKLESSGPTFFQPNKFSNAVGLSVLLLGIGSVVIGISLGILDFTGLVSAKTKTFEQIILWGVLPYLLVCILVLAVMFVAAIDYKNLPSSLQHKTVRSLDKVSETLENPSNKTSIFLYLFEVLFGLVGFGLVMKYLLGVESRWIWVILAILLLAWILFLPTSIAFRRNIPNRWAVFVINLFFGLTVIGWVIAMVIAVSNVAPERNRNA
jgi:hypothetical protein